MQNIIQTLQRPTSLNGEDKSTYYPGAFLANPFPLQDGERERKTTATSGRRCYALYGKSGPLGSLEKTLLESSRWYSPARRLKWEVRPLFSERITEKEYCTDRNMLSKPFVETLNVKDTSSNRYLFRLVPSEHRTEGIEFGLSPTVQTQGLKRCNSQGKTEFIPLELLPTPTAIDAGYGRINKSRSPNAKERPTIALAAKNGLLPTPKAQDCRHALRDRGKSNLGEEMSELAYRQTGKTSQLNPLFVAEMMGFPLMWTALPFLSHDGGKNP